VSATGLDSTTRCHPLAVSEVKVACARRWPAAFHSDPTCVPVFAVAL